MQHRPFLVSAFLLLSGLMGTLSAEELHIPVGEQAGLQPISVPLNGESRQRVLRHFGPPDKEYPRVGKPPITRWDYSQFSVYFEYDRVINSVIRYVPKNPPASPDNMEGVPQ